METAMFSSNFLFLTRNKKYKSLISIFMSLKRMLFFISSISRPHRIYDWCFFVLLLSIFRWNIYRYIRFWFRYNVRYLWNQLLTTSMICCNVNPNLRFKASLSLNTGLSKFWYLSIKSLMRRLSWGPHCTPEI